MSMLMTSMQWDNFSTHAGKPSFRNMPEKTETMKTLSDGLLELGAELTAVLGTLLVCQGKERGVSSVPEGRLPSASQGFAGRDEFDSGNAGVIAGQARALFKEGPSWLHHGKHRGVADFLDVETLSSQ